MSEEKYWNLYELFEQYEQPWITKKNLSQVVDQLEYNYPEVEYTLEKRGDRYRFAFSVPIRVYQELKDKPQPILRGLSQQDAEQIKKIAEKVNAL